MTRIQIDGRYVPEGSEACVFRTSTSWGKPLPPEPQAILLHKNTFPDPPREILVEEDGQWWKAQMSPLYDEGDDYRTFHLIPLCVRSSAA